MLIDCKCGAVNRLPPMNKAGTSKRARCGKCQHVFGIHELVKARPEAPKPPPESPFDESLADFDTTGLDLDTATDEDLIDILLNGRGRASDDWSPFDNGLPLAPVRDELVSKVIPELRRKCFPKIQWATRGEAETQLHDVLVNRLAKDKARIHTYECPFCCQSNGKPFWHVGHSTPSKF